MPAAIVTGGNSGIGRATAVALAADGFDVGITWHRDEDRVESLRSEIGRLEAVHLDLHDLAGGPQAVAELTEKLGGLDVLVNNAGYGTSKPLLEMELAEWQGVIDVNLTAAFLAAQAAAKRWVADGRGGRRCATWTSPIRPPGRCWSTGWPTPSAGSTCS